MARFRHPDIVIAGAGIIGLSLALELNARGAQVTVLERDFPLQHASTAAAGMLAVDDPHNLPDLLLLSRLSAALYPNFLARLSSQSGVMVEFQTSTTVQYLLDGSQTRLSEHSVDPRQLAAAVLGAVRATRINLRPHTEFRAIEKRPGGPQAIRRSGERTDASEFVLATGAWGIPASLRDAKDFITPSKGQMLRVQLPSELRNLDEVHRREDIYVVPRTHGPQAGSALIGATVEDAGFDLSTQTSALHNLRTRAAVLLPALASERDAPQLEAWAGLRPSTPDHLPVLGRRDRRGEVCALGHGRNGILLAPATAMLLADLIEGKSPAIDLAPFSPQRFASPSRHLELPK